MSEEMVIQNGREFRESTGDYKTVGICLDHDERIVRLEKMEVAVEYLLDRERTEVEGKEVVREIVKDLRIFM